MLIYINDNRYIIYQYTIPDDDTLRRLDYYDYITKYEHTRLPLGECG